jgi:predicted Fe-Mo cluster-binding NifX family protein
MGANSNPNKTTALALNQKISAGVDKYFSKVKSLTIGGTTYTPKGLLAVLNAETDASKAVDSTRAQYMEEVATHRTAKAAAFVLRAELKTYILGTYGKKAVQMLGDFGMSVPKSTGKKTVETKAQAVAQSRATREARHTMGKDQKKPIKGTVPSTATVAAAPSSSTPAATPAQVAQASQPAQTTASH